MIYLVWTFKYKSRGTKRLIFALKIFRIDAIFAMKIQIVKKINVSFSVKIQIKVNNKMVWIFAGSQKCHQNSKVNCEIHSSINWNKFWKENPIWIFQTFQFKLLLFSQLLSLNRLSNRVTLTKIKVIVLFSAIFSKFLVIYTSSGKNPGNIAKFFVKEKGKRILLYVKSCWKIKFLENLL